jgi:hypothetical protein
MGFYKVRKYVQNFVMGTADLHHQLIMSNYFSLGFQVYTAMKIHVVVSYVMTPSRPAGCYIYMCEEHTSSVLKLEVKMVTGYSSETFVTTSKTTRRYNSEC